MEWSLGLSCWEHCIVIGVLAIMIGVVCGLGGGVRIVACKIPIPVRV